MNSFYVESLQRTVPVAETEVVTRDITATIHGEDVTVLDAKVRIYSKTGEEVLDELLAQRQGHAFLNNYATRHGLVTAERIIEIREKFGLSQAGFANLLSIDKKVYQSYENGILPTPADSDLIKKVAYQDIAFMQQLLSKSNGQAYTPGDQQRLREIMSYTIEAPKYKLAADIVNWFFAQYCIENYFRAGLEKRAAKIPENDLQKLLYMVQGVFFAEAETYLFDEDTQVDADGPYYASVRLLYQQYADAEVTVAPSMINLLIEEQKELNQDAQVAGVLTYVWARYGDEAQHKIDNSQVQGINQWQAICHATSPNGTQNFYVPNPMVIAAIDFDGSIEDYYDFDGLYLSMSVDDVENDNQEATDEQADNDVIKDDDAKPKSADENKPTEDKTDDEQADDDDE